MEHIDFLKKTWRDYYLETIRPNLNERMMIYERMRAKPNSVYSCNVREKASRDIIFFFKYFLWIFESKAIYRQWYGIDGGDLPFILYPKQEEYVLEIVDAIRNGHDILLEKTREEGASYLIGMIFLWFWIKANEGNDFLIIANKLENVDDKGVMSTIFEKIRYNIRKLEPLGFLPKTYDPQKCNNFCKLKTAPEGGASIIGKATTGDAGRSNRVIAGLLDEGAFLEENAEAIWVATGETCGSRIIVSTPNGLGNLFADLRFSGKIRVLRLHWSDHPLKSAGFFIGPHPHYPEEKEAKLSPWYLWKCSQVAQNPDASIKQELDISYLTTGMPYFREQMEYITNRYKELTDTDQNIRRYDFEIDNNIVKLFPYPSGRMFIKTDPVMGWKYRYCISADTAEGLEDGDNNSMVVYDRVKKEDVAWFTGKCDTHVFALLLVYFGFKYDKAYIAPEKNNTSGGAVLNELKHSYSYLLYEQDFSLRVPRDKARLGWSTNVATRGTMLGTLRKAIAEKCEGIYDLQFYNEAMTFVTKNGKPQAESGKHDDRVMTQAIKFMIHNWLPAPEKIDEKVDKFKGQYPFGIKPERQRDPRQIWRT